ncbi:MAG: condensation domain-containing protein [Propionibacteriaceae bacterium]|nr:condensation domain-containing protein [Propionibacteriaceae bacterium]
MTSSSVLSGAIEQVGWLTDDQAALFAAADAAAGGPPLVFQQSITLWGPLDPSLAAAAVQLVVVRHAALRTVVVHRGVARPVQMVLFQRRATVGAVDLRSFDAVARGRHAAGLIEQDLSTRFDLQRDPLLRVTLVRQADEQTLLLFAVSPLVADTWSLGVVIEDFLFCYERLLRGAEIDALAAEARELGRRERNFLSWAQGRSARPADAEFWVESVKGAGGPARPPALTPKASRPTTWASREAVLDPAETERVLAAARAHGLPVETYAEAAWGLVLQRAAGRRDVVFGSVRANRGDDRADLRRAVGPFAAAVPARVTAEPDDTVASFLRRVDERATAALGQPRCALAEVARETGLGADLLATLFEFEGRPLESDGLSAVSRAQVKMESSYPPRRASCVATAALAAGRLRLWVGCDAPYVRRDAERILDWWRTALTALAADDVPLDELDITPDDERTKILEEFNEATFELPEDTTVAGLVAQRAAAESEGVALWAGERTVTWSELARLIEEAGLVPPEAASEGHAADASAPESPSETEAANPRQAEPLTSLSLGGAVELTPEGGTANPREPEPPAGLSSGAVVDRTPEAVAAVIAGLTDPAHVNFALNPTLDQLFDHEKPVLVSVAPAGSPGFAVECLALARGVPVVLADESELAESARFAQLVWSRAANVVVAEPEALAHLTSASEHLGFLTAVRRIVIPGPDYPVSLVRRLALYTTATWFRAHTPTGRGLWVTLGPVARVAEERPNLGRPLANVRLYVMDGRRSCGIGQAGELCVPTGALPGDSPETMPNPFGEGLLARTGDRARWLPDGQLDLLGP